MTIIFTQNDDFLKPGQFPQLVKTIVVPSHQGQFMAHMRSKVGKTLSIWILQSFSNLS